MPQALHGLGGGGAGRLPLWLEGRAASYASSRPYGLYQQLSGAWVGVAPEEGDELARAALDRAMKAVFAGEADDEPGRAAVPADGPRAGRVAIPWPGSAPEQLQRATFEALRALVARLMSPWPYRPGVGGPALGRPDLAPPHRRAFRLPKQGPLLLVAHPSAAARPGGVDAGGSLRSDRGLQLRTIELSPLPAPAEVALARSLVGEGALREIIEAVRESAEGNPCS